MSVLDNLKDMYDVKLKPRMLRTIIREQFSDEDHPGRLPSGLTKLISLVRTHKLLSESFDDSVDKKLVGSWKSAVDEWLHAVLSLVSSNMSNKCWTGICLLGVTCQECGVDRFLASFSVWFDNIYSHIQAEAAIVSKLISGSCSFNMMKKLAYCLALLPKSKGDDHSWCLMMQKILLLINVQLNDFFQGFEEETKGTEVVRALVSPGKDPPPPLGGLTLLGEALDKARKQLPISTISVLILSCCMMLTSPYPVQEWHYTSDRK